MSAEAPPKGVVPPTEPGGRSGFLSDVIVELGFATPEAVEEAVREARSGSTVAQVLVETGRSPRSSSRAPPPSATGSRTSSSESFEVDGNAAALIRPSAAKRYLAVPVGFVGGGLLVAMADPADSLAVNDIAVMTKLDVAPAAVTRSALDALLAQLATAAEAEERRSERRLGREDILLVRGLLAGGRRRAGGDGAGRRRRLCRRGADAGGARGAAPEAGRSGDRAGEGARGAHGLPGGPHERPRQRRRHDRRAGDADPGAPGTRARQPRAQPPRWSSCAPRWRRSSPNWPSCARARPPRPTPTSAAPRSRPSWPPSRSGSPPFRPS